MSLTKHDKTRFLERGFTVVENVGRNLRLIKRDDAREAISIKWEDLPALRELITLALDDGPMVIGRDISGQNAENAADSMRSRCVEKVKLILQRYRDDAEKADKANDNINMLILLHKASAATEIANELESGSIQEQKSFPCGAPRPDDGSECLYGVCPRPRDGCSEYCWQHHRSQCVVQEQEAKQS